MTLRIAILGASGQIGKGLTQAFAGEAQLFLFARSPHRVERFLTANTLSSESIKTGRMEEFPAGAYDVVINAAGPGDPKTLGAPDTNILTVTEDLDRLGLRYVVDNPDAAYIYLSTGAIYGPDYDTDVFTWPVNAPPLGRLYPLAKLTAEARHRALTDRKIADIRIFGYFSRHADRSAGFLLSQISDALLSRRRLVTGPEDLVRDYIGPNDLVALIRCLLRAGTPNGSYDIYSDRPATKFQILELLEGAVQLAWDVEGGDARRREPPQTIARDGMRAASLGYKPKLSTLSLVEREIRAILESAEVENELRPTQSAVSS